MPTEISPEGLKLEDLPKPLVPSIQFNAHAFAFAASFQAKGDIRYYLCGVSVRPHPNGGVILCGTDGHQMGLAYDPMGRTDVDRILVASPGLVKAARDRNASRVAIVNGRLAVLGGKRNGMDSEETWSDALETHIQAGRTDIDGKFPDPMALIPDPKDMEPGMHGPIQAHLVERMCSGFRIFSNCGHRSRIPVPVEHYTVPSKGSVFTQTRNSANLLVVTMPMRIDGKIDPLPLFVQPKKGRRS